METHSTESRCYRTENRLFAGASVRASFSPEILQAGAVKGLRDKSVVYNNTDFS